VSGLHGQERSRVIVCRWEHGKNALWRFVHRRERVGSFDFASRFAGANRDAALRMTEGGGWVHGQPGTRRTAEFDECATRHTHYPLLFVLDILLPGAVLCSAKLRAVSRQSGAGNN